MGPLARRTSLISLLLSFCALCAVGQDQVRGTAWTIGRRSTDTRGVSQWMLKPLWDDNLLSFPFERDDSPAEYDVGPLSNDGSYTNASVDGTWSPTFGGCRIFDGVDDYIETTGLFMNGLADYTLSVWAKPDDTNTYQAMAGWNENGAPEDENIAVVYVSAGSWGATDERENVIDGVADPAAALLGSWSHIAYTVVQNGNLTLYVNGVQVAQSGGVANVPVNQAVNLYIGGRSVDAGPLSFFNGALDDPQAYGRALASNEVYSLYLAGSTNGPRGVH